MAQQESAILTVGIDQSYLSRSVSKALADGARQAQRLGTLKLNIDERGFRQPLGRITADVSKFDQSLEAANQRVIAFGASAGVIVGIAKGFRSLVNSTIEVEKSFKEINSIFQLSSSGLSKFGDNLFDVARKTGQSFKIAAEAATEFSRQGLSAEETLKRVSDALTLTRLSGLEVTKSVDAITAALNGFNKSILTSADVVNKFATVDASFAVSSADLAEALSRVGSSAQDAGIEIDELIGLVTSAKQTTGRDGAVIGNALKTILTRLERNTTVEAIEDLGIAIRDTAGNVKPVIEIIETLAKSYDTLGKAQQSQIAELAGGVFQINQLKALFSDLSKENSIFAQATQTSGKASEEAARRLEYLNQSVSTLLQNLATTGTQAGSKIGEIIIKPLLQDLTGIGNRLLEPLKNIDTTDVGVSFGEGILRGIGNVFGTSSGVPGPGLIAITAALSKVIGTTAKLAVKDLASLANFSGDNQNVQVQAGIQKTLASATEQEKARFIAAKGTAEQEKIILGILERQLAVANQLAARQTYTAGNIQQNNPALAKQLIKYGTPPKAAGGYLPVAEEKAAIRRGTGGAIPSAQPVVIPNFNFGKGKKGTIVANSDEYMVPNFAGSGGSAIFNRDMVSQYGLPKGAQKIAANGYVPNFANQRLYEKGLASQIGSGYFGKAYKLGEKNIVTKRFSGARDFAQENLKNEFRILSAIAEKSGDAIDYTKPIGSLERTLQRGYYGKPFVENAQQVDLAVNNSVYLSESINSVLKNKVGRDLKNINLPDLSIDPDIHQGNYGFNEKAKKFLSNISRNKNRQGEISRILLNVSDSDKKTDRFLKSLEKVGAKFNIYDPAVYGTAAKGYYPNYAPVFSGKYTVGGESPTETGLSFSNYLKKFDPTNREAIKKIKNPRLLRYLIANVDRRDPTGTMIETFRQYRGISKLQITPRELRSTDYLPLTGSEDDIIKQISQIYEASGAKAPRFSHGYIPNFNKALTESVKREMKAGVPLDQIYIDTDKRLKNSQNPEGILVANKRDEPVDGSQGVNRVLMQGIDPKKAGKAHGYIPNFVQGKDVTNIFKTLFPDLDLGSGQLASNTDALREEINQIIKKGLNIKSVDFTQDANKVKKQLTSLLSKALNIQGDVGKGAQNSLGRIADEVVATRKKEIQGIKAYQTSQKQVQDSIKKSQNDAIRDAEEYAQKQGGIQKALSNTIGKQQGVKFSTLASDAVKDKTSAASSRNLRSVLSTTEVEKELKKNLQSLSFNQIGGILGNSGLPGGIATNAQNKAGDIAAIRNKFNRNLYTENGVNQNSINAISAFSRSGTLETDFIKNVQTQISKNGKSLSDALGAAALQFKQSGGTAIQLRQAITKNIGSLDEFQKGFVGSKKDINLQSRVNSVNDKLSGGTSFGDLSKRDQNLFKLIQTQNAISQLGFDKSGASRQQILANPEARKQIEQAVQTSISKISVDKAIQAKADAQQKSLQRGQTISNAALGLSFVAPLLAGFIPEGRGGTGAGKTSGAITGGIQGAASGAAIGSFFGPLGVGIGAGVGGLGGAIAGFIEKSRKSFEELAQQIEDSNAKNAQLINRASEFLSLQQSIDDAIETGRADKVAGLIKRQSQAFGGIDDAEIRRNLSEGTKESFEKAIDLAGQAQRRRNDSSTILSSAGRATEEVGSFSRFFGKNISAKNSLNISENIANATTLDSKALIEFSALVDKDANEALLKFSDQLGIANDQIVDFQKQLDGDGELKAVLKGVADIRGRQLENSNPFASSANARVKGATITSRELQNASFQGLQQVNREEIFGRAALQNRSNIQSALIDLNPILTDLDRTIRSNQDQLANLSQAGGLEFRSTVQRSAFETLPSLANVPDESLKEVVSGFDQVLKTNSLDPLNKLIENTALNKEIRDSLRQSTVQLSQILDTNKAELEKAEIVARLSEIRVQSEQKQNLLNRSVFDLNTFKNVRELGDTARGSRTIGSFENRGRRLQASIEEQDALTGLGVAQTQDSLRLEQSLKSNRAFESLSKIISDRLGTRIGSDQQSLQRGATSLEQGGITDKVLAGRIRETLKVANFNATDEINKLGQGANSEILQNLLKSGNINTAQFASAKLSDNVVNKIGDTNSILKGETNSILDKIRVAVEAKESNEQIKLSEKALSEELRKKEGLSVLRSGVVTDSLNKSSSDSRYSAIGDPRFNVDLQTRLDQSFGSKTGGFFSTERDAGRKLQRNIGDQITRFNGGEIDAAGLRSSILSPENRVLASKAGQSGKQFEGQVNALLEDFAKKLDPAIEEKLESFTTQIKLAEESVSSLKLGLDTLAASLGVPTKPVETQVGTTKAVGATPDNQNSENSKLTKIVGETADGKQILEEIQTSASRAEAALSQGTKDRLQEFKKFSSGFREELALITSQYNDTAQVGATVAQSFHSNFTSAFGDFVTGASSAKDAFKGFISSVLSDASRAFATAGFNNLFNSFLGGGGGGATSSTGGGLGSFFGSLFGGGGKAMGGPIGFAKGGLVPTMLTGGEFILDPEQAKKIGPNMLRKLNSGTAAKYAMGGIVRGGSGVRDDVAANLRPGSYVIKKSSVQKYGGDYLGSLAAGRTQKRFLGGMLMGALVGGGLGYLTGGKKGAIVGAIGGGLMGGFAQNYSQSGSFFKGGQNSSFFQFGKGADMGSYGSIIGTGKGMGGGSSGFGSLFGGGTGGSGQGGIGSALAQLGVGAALTIGQSLLAGKGSSGSSASSTVSPADRAAMETAQQSEIDNMKKKGQVPFLQANPQGGFSLLGFGNVPATRRFSDGGEVPVYRAEGGYVGGATMAMPEIGGGMGEAPSAQGSIKIEVNINDNRTSTAQSQEGDFANPEFSKKLADQVRTITLETINKEQRIGGSLRASRGQNAR